MEIGQMIYGFAGGYFGRDSYSDRRIEAKGFDWVVTRNAEGQAEFSGGLTAYDWSVLANTKEDPWDE